MIGLSRVYLRVHYLSDVIAGAFCGLIFGAASVVIFDYFTRMIGLVI
jgi:undecaprenyl-diphosphatase